VPLRPIWLNSTFAGSPYASTKRNRSRPLADRQLAQGLPMKRFQNKGSAMQLFPLSVAIALALTLFLGPMPRAFAAQECDMFGISPIEARNCHGCCAQMKCCSVPNHGEKSQPALPGSNNRSDSSGDNILVDPKFSVLLHELPGDSVDYRPYGLAPVAPVFSSLARLCIRLI